MWEPNRVEENGETVPLRARNTNSTVAPMPFYLSLSLSLSLLSRSRRRETRSHPRKISKGRARTVVDRGIASRSGRK